uniref:Uncharacterized protein n=1 Tax=Knipowitschia caucasica TaxID=637954 RepID=A0AAV2JE77_KNICA
MLAWADVRQRLGHFVGVSVKNMLYRSGFIDAIDESCGGAVGLLCGRSLVAPVREQSIKRPAALGQWGSVNGFREGPRRATGMG